MQHKFAEPLSVLNKIFFKTVNGAFNSIKLASIKHIRSKADITQRFEVLNQEQDILQEELQQALYLNEELED